MSESANEKMARARAYQADFLAKDAPELAALVQTADAPMQRRIATETVRFAFSASPIKTAEAEVLDAMNAGQYGDSPLREWLNSEWLEAEARSDEAVEAGRDADGFAHSLHARALGVARRALDADPAAAATGSVYEATFTAHPDTDVASVVRRVLAG